MTTKQISSNGLFRRTTVLSFDETSVYIGEGDGRTVVPFEDVVSLSRTNSQLNNRFFWRLVYRVGDATKVETFRANATLWNHNFPDFHARLSAANPAAVKSPWRWWSF